MNRFLLGALATVSLLVLTSFALTRTSTSTIGPAWTVSQYQLDRAFRVEVPYSAFPVTIPAPATQGMIITQLKIADGFLSLTVGVNGATEAFDFSTTAGPRDYSLNPPIIVRPGDVLSISQGSGGGSGSPRITIAGYTTLPGET